MGSFDWRRGERRTGGLADVARGAARLRLRAERRASGLRTLLRMVPHDERRGAAAPAARRAARTARCWPPTCRSRCSTAASASSTSRPSPSSTSTARASATPASCRT
ncbi:MAG: hypothetical protein MZW92_00140 [Comamonadaceae bacterium]|nr:hypothetical protein [Comamonadaceae bacterium]